MHKSCQVLPSALAVDRGVVPIRPLGGPGRPEPPHLPQVIKNSTYSLDEERRRLVIKLIICQLPPTDATVKRDFLLELTRK